MSTRASIGGHPIHSMVIGLPIGLFVFSFFSDLIWLYTRSPAWETVALYTLIGAIVTALLSAVPGFVDYGGLRHERSRSVARWHMAINLLAVGAGVANLWLRTSADDPTNAAVIASAATVGLLGVSGWLGATLVHVHGVSQPDAPNEHKVRTIDARPETAPPPADAPRRSATGRTAGSTPAAPIGGLHPAMQPGSNDAPRSGSGSIGGPATPRSDRGPS